MKLVILGAGPGGYVAAIKAARLGAQVTVIEEKEVGGTCLNWGCIPTKVLISSTKLLTRIQHSEEFGIEIKDNIIPNLKKIIERKNKIVDTQIKGIKRLFNRWGILLKKGKGILNTPNIVTLISKDASKEKISADSIIIATGSRPAELSICPFDGDKIISSDEAVQIQSIPKSLLIIGGGAIGCEFASIYGAFGTEVTIIEMLPRIVPNEDIEISKILERELKKKKIKLLTETEVKKINIANNRVHTLLSNNEEIVTDKILVSIGRSFNSENIGLQELGIKTGKKGEILVNERMQTNIPNIYAVGDVIGRFLLAHVASKEGTIAARNIMSANEKMDYSAVPSAIFTTPEIASVGLKEHEARERGINFKTGHFEFRALAKSHIIGKIEGLIKVIAESQTDKVLGVHIIGPNASDLIHEAALAIKAGLKIKDISETIHIHPTLSEGIKEAFEDVYNEAIHVFKKQL